MDYLTIQEVSAILKVHSNTVYKMCRQGVLPAVKIGKEWRIDRDKLHGFMEDGVKKAPTSTLTNFGQILPEAGHVLGIFSGHSEIMDFERSFFLNAPRLGYRRLKACWWQDPDEIRQDLTKAGLPVAKLEAGGDMVFLNLSRVFETHGPIGAAGAWFKEVASSLEHGYRGIYGSGSPSFSCCGNHEGLMEFERTLDNMLSGMPVLGVCSYVWPKNARQGLNKVMDLIQLHDRFFMRTAQKEISAQVTATEPQVPARVERESIV